MSRYVLTLLLCCVFLSGECLGTYYYKSDYYEHNNESNLETSSMNLSFNSSEVFLDPEVCKLMFLFFIANQVVMKMYERDLVVLNL